MKNIQFDFNNLFDFCVGAQHGVTDEDVREISGSVANAHRHLEKILSSRESRLRLNLEWAELPYQSAQSLREIKKLAAEVRKYDNLISLGIGGSYLGLKAAQDALCPAYFNEFKSGRKKSPRIYFEGNNLDPDTLSVLLKNLNPKKTFVVVISKSGETTETKAAFMAVEAWLKRAIGKNYGRQIIAVTDPESGTLRKKVNQAQALDKLSFRSLPLLKGVGGRFSEFNMGLLHLAVMGIKIEDVLAGAASMRKICSQPELEKNPAYLYAALHTILYRKKNKPIAIMMPFSETLKSTADWYSQLLAESLGKKYGRKINLKSDNTEEWLADKSRVVNVGRSPISCRGTNDLHSIQQNNIEGANDKVITFIRVEKFKEEIKIKGEPADLLNGKNFSDLIKLAQEATEWALLQEQRPNCAIILPEVSPFSWGELLFFLEMATAFEGELLDINAFDQPGVEGYKNYMYYKLNKPGLPAETVNQIKNNPLKKDPKYIL